MNAVVDANGIVLHVPDLGDVEFPAAAQSTPAHIAFFAAADDSTKLVFPCTAGVLGPGPAASYQIEITSDRQLAADSLRLRLLVPASLAGLRAIGFEPAIYVRHITLADDELLDIFDIASAYTDGDTVVTAVIPTSYLTSLRTTDGLLHVVIILAGQRLPRRVANVGVMAVEPNCAVQLSWPVMGVPNVTQPFKENLHDGIDIGNTGDALAAADGEIILSEYKASAIWQSPKVKYCKTSDGDTQVPPGECLTNYGGTVIIQHDEGGQTLYGHLVTNSLPPVHTRVHRGDKIGTIGDTGDARGVHLHFEYAQNRIEFGDHTSRRDPEHCLTQLASFDPIMELPGAPTAVWKVDVLATETVFDPTIGPYLGYTFESHGTYTNFDPVIRDSRSSKVHVSATFFRHYAGSPVCQFATSADLDDNTGGPFGSGFSCERIQFRRPGLGQSQYWEAWFDHGPCFVPGGYTGRIDLGCVYNGREEYALFPGLVAPIDTEHPLGAVFTFANCQNRSRIVMTAPHRPRITLTQECTSTSSDSNATSTRTLEVIMERIQ